MRGPDRRFAALLALVLLGAWPLGCTFDFTEPLQHEAALLRLTVKMDQGTEPVMEVQGEFHPGRDDRGVFRTVEDPTVRVAGESVEPIEVRSDGQIRYQAALTGAPENLTLPMEVHGPEVVGVAIPRPIFRFGVCRREGEELVAVETDGYLRLEVDCVRPPEMDGLVPVRWSLSLTSPDGSFGLQLERSDEPVPSILELPGAWLSGAGVDELEASLSIADEAEWEAELGRYRLTLRIMSVLRWRVRLSG